MRAIHLKEKVLALLTQQKTMVVEWNQGLPWWFGI